MEKKYLYFCLVLFHKNPQLFYKLTFYLYNKTVNEFFCFVFFIIIIIVIMHFGNCKETLSNYIYFSFSYCAIIYDNDRGFSYFRLANLKSESREFSDIPKDSQKYNLKYV